MFLKAVEREQETGTEAQGTGQQEQDSGTVEMVANPASLL